MRIKNPSLLFSVMVVSAISLPATGAQNLRVAAGGLPDIPDGATSTTVTGGSPGLHLECKGEAIKDRCAFGLSDLYVAKYYSGASFASISGFVSCTQGQTKATSFDYDCEAENATLTFSEFGQTFVAEKVRIQTKRGIWNSHPDFITLDLKVEIQTRGNPNDTDDPRVLLTGGGQYWPNAWSGYMHVGASAPSAFSVPSPQPESPTPENDLEKITTETGHTFFADHTNPRLGKMWRAPDGKSWSAPLKWRNNSLYWYSTAPKAAKRCDELGGRLPSRDEYQELIDYMGAAEIIYQDRAHYKPQVLTDMGKQAYFWTSDESTVGGSSVTQVILGTDRGGFIPYWPWIGSYEKVLTRCIDGRRKVAAHLF